jgi:hypothetical protein
VKLSTGKITQKNAQQGAAPEKLPSLSYGNFSGEFVRWALKSGTSNRRVSVCL